MKAKNFSLFLLVLLTSSCDFLAFEDSIAVHLPTLEPDVLKKNAPVSWRYTWLSESNSIRVQNVPASEVPLLAFPREANVIVTAEPIFSESLSAWSFHPAGYVRSVDRPGTESITLSWEQGFAAQFLLELADQGVNLLQFNLRRFKEALEERSKGEYWNINRTKMVEKLIDGSFYYYSISLSELIDTVLPLPEGLWYSDYALQAPLTVQSEGWHGELKEGFHRFIRLDDSLVAEIWIDKIHPPAMILYSINAFFYGKTMKIN